jgi:L-alanine-DL-glutamate epimerase-like enolase superfamily enzyme
MIDRIHDAMGKALGVPVYQLIGGLCQPRIPLEWSVSLDEVALKAHTLRHEVVAT